MNAHVNPETTTNSKRGRVDDAITLTELHDDAVPTRHQARRLLRRNLLLAGPLLVAVIGLAVWLTSGRYVSTEDAYVKADKVTVSAEISGQITRVAVRENQQIKTGDELFRIDDRPYRIALAKADAQMAAVTADINALKASYRQKTEELRLAQTNRDFAEREFQRQSQLAVQHLNSRVQLDDAKHKFDIARQQIDVTEQERAQQLTRLSGNAELPVDAHPNYLEAKAARDAAALDLEHTVIRAPFTGIASKVPQIGQYVNTGTPVMSVVGTEEVWVEANFVETDLANVRVGQFVTVNIDSYPGREWRGKVLSISQATGAEFSVLPPQNASGNWVKIVQRIPLRIAIEPDRDDPPLRVGMTATVTVDTGERHKLRGLLHGHTTVSVTEAANTATAAGRPQ